MSHGAQRSRSQGAADRQTLSGHRQRAGGGERSPGGHRGQAEPDDQHPGHLSHPGDRKEARADEPRRHAEEHEDGAEAGNEEERLDENRAGGHRRRGRTGRVNVRERRRSGLRQEREVHRNQREDAGRHEAHQARHQGEREGQLLSVHRSMVDASRRGRATRPARGPLTARGRSPVPRSARG